eukprot:g85.t1
MDILWGQMNPIPAAQVREVAHEEAIELGDTTVHAHHTPGHAVHHIAWQIGEAIFTGDVAGVRIKQGLVIPPCPPPDIHLGDWEASIEILKRLAPETMYLTHFGPVPYSEEHLDELKRRMHMWADWIKPHYEAERGIMEVTPEFQQMVAEDMITQGISGDSLEVVNIPAIFVSRNTGEVIVPEVDAGETVTGQFSVKSFYDPISSYSYHTPLSEAVDFGDFQINYVSPNDMETTDVTVTATITAPSGAATTLTGMSSVAPLADSVISVDGSFLPTELGMHTITWTNDQSSETLETNFVMTDYTYAIDDDNLTLDIGPSDAQFLEANLAYQAGALSLMDGDGAQATHVSFGIANGAAIFTDDPDADQIAIILYDGDFDDDGILDFADGTGGGANSSFDDLTPIALATYTITGNETGDELIYVELEDLLDGDNIVDLKPDGAYYTVISYDGTNAGLGVAPRFVCTTDLPYLLFPTSPIVLDQFYNGGWAGQTIAIRLHLAGFEDPTGTDDIVQLDAAKKATA